MNIQTELDAITRAEQPLLQLETTLKAELAAAEAPRPTPTTHNRPFELRQAIRHLHEGVSASEGTDPRVWKVLHSEEMAAFHFRAPGLAPLARLRAKLLAEQDKASHPPESPPVFTFRYTGEPWKKVAGARRHAGELIQLTEEQASRWLTVLQNVSAETEAASAELQAANAELQAAEAALRAARGEAGEPPPAA